MIFIVELKDFDISRGMAFQIVFLMDTLSNHNYVSEQNNISLVKNGYKNFID